MSVSGQHRLQVGIVGGTGYTGSELLRLLLPHPGVDVASVTSRAEAGRPLAEAYPHLRGITDLVFREPDAAALAGCDVVFFATPHAAAMHLVPELRAAGQRVIDLSADFRLRDPGLWAQWYGEPHACPDLIESAVYGLPERHRDSLRDAQLVACPGCYPTSIILAMLPLIEAGLADPARLVADAKTGVSGAGRTLKTPFLFGEMAESFKAYGVAGHRHLPEIRQVLGNVVGGDVGLTFVPHLVPMVRGIHATCYLDVADRDTDLQALFEQRYAGEPFVDVMPPGATPETRTVRGSNTCRLAIHRPGGGDVVVVLSVIDNLVKGAAGQAVQCLNLMAGFEETTGLTSPALVP
ncbi:MAG: N-acetyl-gamma-glutamyl-phosphate reductase [Salinisphaeraceae bacterium]